MISVAKNLDPVPLPDVWLPLNDSLRMITGFGSQEVIVGNNDTVLDIDNLYAKFARNDNVATVINKNNILTPSALNKPRFDARGILLEDTSANLFTYSAPRSAEATGFTVENMTDFTGFVSDPVKLTLISAGSYLLRKTAVATATVQTFSVFINYKQSTARNLILLARNDTTAVNELSLTLNLDNIQATNGYRIVYRDWETDRKSTRLNSSHSAKSRMPSSA